MSGLTTAIEELLLTALVSEKMLLPRRSRTDWALSALSVLLFGSGVGLSVLALERYLETRFAPDMAALSAAATVFAAACLSAAAISSRRRKSSEITAMREELGKNIRVLVGGLCEELEEPIRDNPKTAVELAALAGFCAVRQNN